MKPISPSRMRDFLTPQQQAALDSGDKNRMQAADDAALAAALLASLAEQEKQTAQYNTVTKDSAGNVTENGLPATTTTATMTATMTAPTTTNASTDHASLSPLQIQLENTDKLRSWLEGHGFDIVKNRGGGHNDCLLISLLQHATGDYSSEHAADVAHYRKVLTGIDPRFARDDALPSMSEAIAKLIEKINRDKKCDLRIAFVAPGLEGEPTYHFYGSGKRYAMIFDESGHFDAVVPRRI